VLGPVRVAPQQTMSRPVLFLATLAVLTLGSYAVLPFNQYLSYRKTALDNSYPCTELCSSVGNGIAETLVGDPVPQSLLMGDTTAEDAKDYITKATVAGLIVPVVFGAITLLACLGFTLGRSCCNTFGGRIATESYTKRVQFRLRIVLVFWIACIIVLFGLILATNRSVSRGVDKSIEGTDQLVMHYQSLKSTLQSMTQVLDGHTQGMTTLGAMFQRLPDATDLTTHKSCLEGSLPKVDKQGKAYVKIQAVHDAIKTLPGVIEAQAHLSRLAAARSALPSQVADGLTTAFSTVAPQLDDAADDAAGFSASIAGYTAQVGAVDTQATSIKGFLDMYLPLKNETEYLATYLQAVRTRESTLDANAVFETLEAPNAPSSLTCPEVRTQLLAIYEIILMTQDPQIYAAQTVEYFDKYNEASLSTISDTKTNAVDLESALDLVAGTLHTNLVQYLEKLQVFECDSCDTSDPANAAAYIAAQLPNLATLRSQLKDVPASAKAELSALADAVQVGQPKTLAEDALTSLDSLLSPPDIDINCLADTLPVIANQDELPITLPPALQSLAMMIPYVLAQQDPTGTPTGPELFESRLSALQTDLTDIKVGLDTTSVQAIADKFEDVLDQFAAANELDDIDAFVELAEDIAGRVASLAPTLLLSHMDQLKSYAQSNVATTIADQLQELYDAWADRPSETSFPTVSTRIDTFNLAYYLKDTLEGVLNALPEAGCTASDIEGLSSSDIQQLSILTSFFPAVSFDIFYSDVQTYLTGIADKLGALEATAQASTVIENILTHASPFVLPNSLPPRYAKDIGSGSLEPTASAELIGRLDILRPTLNQFGDKVSTYNTTIPAISAAFDEMPSVEATSKGISVGIEPEVDPNSPDAATRRSLIYTPTLSGYAVLIPHEFDSSAITGAKDHVDLLAQVKTEIDPASFNFDSGAIQDMASSVQAAVNKMSEWLGNYHSGRKKAIQQGLPFDEQRLIMVDSTMIVLVVCLLGTGVSVIRLKHKPMMFLVMIFSIIGVLSFLLSAFHLTLGVVAEGGCKDTTLTLSTLVGESQIDASTLEGFVSFLGITTSDTLTASQLALYQAKCIGSEPDIVTKLSDASTNPPAFVSEVEMPTLTNAVTDLLTTGATTSSAFDAEVNAMSTRASRLIEASAALGDGLKCSQTQPLFHAAVERGICTEVAGALSLLGCLLFLLGLCLWPGIICHAMAFKRFNKANLVRGPDEGVGEIDDEDEDDEVEVKSKSKSKTQAKDDTKAGLLANPQPVPRIHYVPIAHGYELSQLKGFKNIRTDRLVLQSPVVAQYILAAQAAQDAQVAQPQQPVIVPPQKKVSVQPK